MRRVEIMPYVWLLAGRPVCGKCGRPRPTVALTVGRGYHAVMIWPPGGLWH